MSLARFFDFEPAGSRLEDLETPVPVIDIAVVERNFLKWQAQCDHYGVANRPHFKTHKLAPLAKAQMALGAKGMAVQKLGEAEVVADAGIADILLCFNVVGRAKQARLAHLMRRTDIKTVADNDAVVESLAAAAAQGGRDLAVLVECETGMNRNGVQTPGDALALAQTISRTKGLKLGGLMTYPAIGKRAQMAAFIEEALALLAKAGLEAPIVTSGGSPDMWKDEGLKQVTEYRSGTYAYFDRMQVARGSCTFDDCALTVLATVVSRPTADRAIIDAGSKSLTSDLVGLEGYGLVRALDGAMVYAHSEEHGNLDVSKARSKPKVGDLVRILPNHVCPVSNLFDKVVFVDGNKVLGAVRVDARGHQQ